MRSEASGARPRVSSRRRTYTTRRLAGFANRPPPRKAFPIAQNLEIQDLLLRPNYLPVPHVDRYLRQRGPGRARDDPGAVGGVEERAVARAGERAGLVRDGAAGVGADR